MAFDFERAERLARLCGAVHAASADRLDGTTWDGGPVRAFAGTGLGSTSLAAVVDLGDRIAVAFRGTLLPSRGDLRTPLEDWLRNLDVRLEPFAATARTPAGRAAVALPLTGLVHGGFLRELTAVLGPVEDALLALPRRPVSVTGHSQGGAIAVLCARVLEAAGWTVEDVYTFAAPRTGDAAAVGGGAGAITIHRVEYGHDVVPHVPPVALTGFGAALLAKSALLSAGAEPWLARWAKLYGSPLPYAAAGTLWYARAGEGRVRAYGEAEEAGLARRRLRGLVGAGPAMWRDHDLRNYLAAVR